VVSLVLVGVPAGEPADHGGELSALPDVGIDGHRVAGSSVGAGEGLAACGRELDQAGGDQVGGRDDLHVAELPDVIVVPVERAPAGENVGGALDQSLAADHPLAVAAVATRLSMSLVYRRSSLLDLQEQWIGAGTALQQHQVDLHAHAAHPHDLADHVDRGEPVEQGPPVLLQGYPVLGQEVVDQVVLLVVADRDADGRVLGDPGAPVRHRGELGEGSPARAALALLLDVNRDPPAVGWLEVADQVVDVRAVVPDVELGHCRVPAHAPGIGLYARGHRGRCPGRLDAALPRGHHQAGGEALDIPLKRAGQGFVEVAQVERQIPLRRSPQAEVQDMGIAAQLHHQPAVGLATQIAGHDRGGAPEIVPRRDGHALMPEGNQFGHADLILGQDRLQRVVPAVALAPGPQRAP
jgi:hypothetical protein